MKKENFMKQHLLTFSLIISAAAQLFILVKF